MQPQKETNIKKKTEPDNPEKQVSFDKYIETYKKEVQGSINFIGQDVDFFIELKANLLIGIAIKYLGSAKEIKTLDIGSGVGLVDRFLLKEMKNLYGVDVEGGVVEKAKKNNPSVIYDKYDGMSLPFENGSFDMAFAINVMHHVQPDGWENFTDEMFRILKPGGIAAVFEHNPLNPLTRLAVSRCEFDRDAVLLSHRRIIKLFLGAGFETLDDAYIVFFPLRSGIFRTAEKFIKWLPLGAQHYAVGRKL